MGLRITSSAEVNGYNCTGFSTIQEYVRDLSKMFYRNRSFHLLRDMDKNLSYPKSLSCSSKYIPMICPLKHKNDPRQISCEWKSYPGFLQGKAQFIIKLSPSSSTHCGNSLLHFGRYIQKCIKLKEEKWKLTITIIICLISWNTEIKNATS